MNLVSIVAVAIKKGKKFLIVARYAGRHKKPIWQFPSGEFEENSNGNLDDTIKRILREIIADFQQNTSRIDYLGSYVRKRQDKIFIGYNFLIENFEGVIKSENFKWVGKKEIKKGRIKNIEVGQNTLIFLKLNKEFL